MHLHPYLAFGILWKSGSLRTILVIACKSASEVANKDESKRLWLDITRVMNFRNRKASAISNPQENLQNGILRQEVVIALDLTQLIELSIHCHVKHCQRLEFHCQSYEAHTRINALCLVLPGTKISLECFYVNHTASMFCPLKMRDRSTSTRYLRLML